MKKLSIGLLVALSTTVLSGCALYFGEDHDDDSWTYCGSDGYYTCEDENCQWVSATCPDSGSGGGWGSGSGGGGFSCEDNNDCAAGCYCADNGTCEEAGFCTQDSDCGAGYECNEERSSCEPSGTSTCDWDYECAQGEYCAIDNTCTATCVCTDDETAVANGYGWCDETRNTCLPGQDPAGTCGGVGGTTCQTFAPVCPSGQVPTLIDGCYTGQCRDYAQCDVNPVCENINTEAQCLGQMGCDDVQNGINCRDANGNNCQPGVGCTCDSYVFASCKTL
jgi:hypothetical protein